MALRNRFLAAAVVFCLASGGLDAPAGAQPKTPYWASISASKARIRTGPGRQFPATWMYQRANLPVKVVATYPNWRKIRDPDGTEGWMQANLLSSVRTGMVTEKIIPMRESPTESARILWRAESGVVGKISECARGWCRFDVNGRMGYVESAMLWGVDKEAAPSAPN